MCCYCTIDIPSKATIYHNDLVIDDNFKNSYFTKFYATGGIAAYHIGDILIPSNVPILIKNFYDEIEKYSKLLTSLEKIELKPTLNRLIFIGTICALDVLLSETFLALIFSDKKLFINYLNFRGKSKEKDYSNGAIEQKVEIEEEIRKTIVEKTHFQKISSDTKILYEKTLGVTFPSNSDMEDHIKFRNDLVHRNGKTKKGHRIIVTEEKVNQLFLDSKKFVSEFANTVKPFSELND
jgi:hypothetical protein